MEWYQYYGKWLSTAFGEPWTVWQAVSFVIAIIGAIIAPIIAHRRPKWSKLVNRLIWQIPLGIFGLLFLIGLITAPYRIYSEEKVMLSSLDNRISALEQQLIIEKKSQAIILYENMPPISNNIPIIFTNATANSLTINEKVFIGCDILGPSTIHFNKCSIVNCVLSNKFGRFVVFSESQNSSGIIILENCVFRDCTFWDVSIIGDNNEIEEYKDNIILR